MPEVSYAVILTRDAERAATAVHSIAAQTPDAELLLVLNEADADMRAYAGTLAAEGARILHDGADLGVVCGWNLALRAARSPAVCVVHEDAELQPGCAARLLGTLRDRPGAGAIGPLVLPGDGSSRQHGAVVWSDGATSVVGTLPADVHAVDYASSSCLMLRLDAARGAGGFDERFFPALYVDAALGVALWRAGRSVLCDRRAVSLHRRGAMVDPARGPRRGPRMREFLLKRNSERFRAAFGDWLAGQAQRGEVADAGHPRPSELDDALRRARSREQRLLAEPLAALPDALVAGEDLEAVAAVRRRALEDEFLAELIDRERVLADEVAGLHRAYAVLHADRDEVHREHAALHRELERVHREYASLWDDRERLRQLATPNALSTEEHA